jgi:hypothetical protein
MPNCFTAEGRVFRYKHLRGGQKYSTILQCTKVPRCYMALNKESNDSALLDQRLLPADAQCIARPLHSPSIPDCKGPALVGEAPGRYHNTESWEMTVPADLIPAVKHLRKSFAEAHWGLSWTAQKYCYAALHSEEIDDPAKEYFNYLMYMKVRVGAAAAQRFHDLLKQGTPPAIFKGFFDPIWVRNVCDVQVLDPQDDDREWIFWRKWQAPMFIIMKPSRYQPYHAITAWERNDSETSSQWLGSFTEHHVLHLENRVREAAGAAALELAKKQEPVGSAAERSSLVPNVGPTVAAGRPITNSAGRDARKLDSQARYKLWHEQKQPPKRTNQATVFCLSE